MTEAQDLAQAVLAMFELQREYFKTRNPEQLNQCRTVETALKRRCKAILAPVKKDVPTLFPTE